jgi:hypothetical protein
LERFSRDNYESNSEMGRRGAVLVLGGRELPTAVALDGRTVSAIVPDGLFQAPGEHSIFLFARTRRQRSEVVRLPGE